MADQGTIGSGVKVNPQACVGNATDFDAFATLVIVKRFRSGIAGVDVDVFDNLIARLVVFGAFEWVKINGPS